MTSRHELKLHGEIPILDETQERLGLRAGPHPAQYLAGLVVRDGAEELIQLLVDGCLNLQIIELPLARLRNASLPRRSRNGIPPAPRAAHGEH